jgi:hypothetical protein
VEDPYKENSSAFKDNAHGGIITAEFIVFAHSRLETKRSTVLILVSIN